MPSSAASSDDSNLPADVPGVTTTSVVGNRSGTEWILTTSPPLGLFTSSSSSLNSGDDDDASAPAAAAPSPPGVFSYRSPRTSLRGLLILTDEPLCSLHIVLATESHGGNRDGKADDDGNDGKKNVESSSTSPSTLSWHHPDDGLPHTLEHLVFLGSRTHPHKGVLDKLANRSMADGTNAWTATDHTAYTLTTAGSGGALNLLPIFADHVLFPTLTESGFATEVHHVNGAGEDKGVVYCEMQGRENNEGSLVDRAVLDLLYPDPEGRAGGGAASAAAAGGKGGGRYEYCGYSAETGGKLANLRTLTADKCRRYHEEYYTPDNCLIVLSGNVGEADGYLDKLDEVEALILQRRREENGEQGADGGKSRRRRGKGRPWHDSPVPPMTTNGPGIYSPRINDSTTADDEQQNAAPLSTATTADPSGGDDVVVPVIVSFPSEDESRGCISLAWRAPSYSSRLEWLQLNLLWEYLTDAPTSPLQRAFVECDDPVCAEVGPATEVFGFEGYHQAWLQEVDVGRMDEAVPLFYETVARQAGVRLASSTDARMKEGGEDDDDDDGGGFDVERMRNVVSRYRRRLLQQVENRPTDAVMDGVIRNFIYGPRGGNGDGDDPSEGADAMGMRALHADADELPLLARTDSSAAHWQGLLRKYILDRPAAVVFGKPSASYASDLSKAEKERESKQAESLGPDGLALRQAALNGAVAANETAIPEEVLTSVPVPDLAGVRSIPLFTVRLSPPPSSSSSDSSTTATSSLEVITESVRATSDGDVRSIVENLKSSSGSVVLSPFHADLTHIESAFAYVAVGMDTSSLAPSQRSYLPILDEIFFKLPATLDDGTEVSRDDFVNRLQDETVTYSSGTGLFAAQMFYASVQVMIEKKNKNDDDNDGSSFTSGPEVALSWIRRVLYQTTITPEAVKTALMKLASNISPQVRDGPVVVGAVSTALKYDSEKSNVVAMGPLRQKVFLAGVLERIGVTPGVVGGDDDDEVEGGDGKDEAEEGEEEGSDDDDEDEDDADKYKDVQVDEEALQEIVAELETIRSTLANTGHMHAFVAANLQESPNLLEALVASLTPPPGDEKLSVVRDGLIENVSASSVLRPSISGEGGDGAVVALSAIESGFLTVTASGLKAYDPDHGALLVATEYLTALEGDFWVKLRGAGLTYGSSISDSTDSGLLKFALYKCTDVPAAFDAAANIVADYAGGKLTMSAVGLENAKSSLAYHITRGRSTKLGAAISSFVRIFQGEKMDYDRHLLTSIANVTEQDAMHALVTYLVPIFDPKSQLVVACPTNKLDVVHDYFVKRGWVNLRKVAEEDLFSAFDVNGKKDGGEGDGGVSKTSAALPSKVPGMSMFLPGAFAQQFQCACPRCER